MGSKGGARRGWRLHWPGCAIHSKQNGSILPCWEARGVVASAVGLLASDSSVEAELRAFMACEVLLALLLGLLLLVKVAELPFVSAAAKLTVLFCICTGLTCAAEAAEAGRADAIVAGVETAAAADAEAGLGGSAAGTAGADTSCVLAARLLPALLVGTCMQADSSACMAVVLPVLALLGFVLGSGGAYTTVGRGTGFVASTLSLLTVWVGVLTG